LRLVIEHSHISCFAFRKKALNYLLNRFCDDVGLIFSILRAGKTHAMSEKMFSYRQRQGSIMNKADKLELCIIELMLFQDVTNAGGFRLTSLSRFAKPLEYVYLNKELLADSKYNKYINDSLKYPNDYLTFIRNNSNGIRMLIRTAKMYGLVFEKFRKLNSKLTKFVNFFNHKHTNSEHE